MIRRFRSPSLFFTFAISFLSVLVLGVLLQGFVTVGVIHPIMKRAMTSRADLLLRQLSREIASAIATSAAPDVRDILRRYTSNADSLVFAFRAADGRVFVDRELPPMLAEHVGRLLGGRPDVVPPGPPPGHGPQGGGPPDRPPPGRPGFGRPPPGGRHFRTPLQVLSRSDVVHEGRVLGEVAALQARPRFPLLPVPEPQHLWMLFLFVPIAILVAGTAGLVLFRIFLRRLRELDRLAARVAEGDLDVRVQDPGPDEIGRLGASLNHMTESLATAKRLVDESDRQRRQLFADISHELATPLTSIRGYTETLLNQDVPLSSSERRKFLEHVFDESKRLDLLIQDLLELTRLEAGASALEKELLDWTELCRNTMRRFESRFHDAGLELRWEGAADAAWIYADGRRMEQVVDNLLTNALRYVPAGGHVAMALGSTPGSHPSSYHLTVSDDGAGFPANDLLHVFERFYRGAGSRSAPGTGLGLAIVHEIVRRHGGCVRAENRKPTGAVLHVEIPADLPVAAGDGAGSPS